MPVNSHWTLIGYHQPNWDGVLPSTVHILWVYSQTIDLLLGSRTPTKVELKGATLFWIGLENPVSELRVTCSTFVVYSYARKIPSFF